MNEINYHNDAFILSRLKNGSDQAFIAIYNRFWRLLKAQAYYFLQDAFQAEDVVQDVFAWLWKNRDDLRTDISLETYLLRATINACIDDKRKQKNLSARKKLYSYILDTQYEQLKPETKELGKLLKKALEEVKPGTRRAFEMAYIENTKTSLVAAQLSITHQHARTRISRALKSLRSSLSHFRLF